MIHSYYEYVCYSALHYIFKIYMLCHSMDLKWLISINVKKYLDFMREKDDFLYM